jgi:CheY-like chemotaxis protein
MKTILVLDDDSIFRRIISQYLKQAGYAVIEESSGKQVINQVLKHSPCACFVDIIMDDKEGLETIEELNQLTEKPIIVAVSSDQQYLEWAKDFGADFLLLKPIAVQKVDQILAVISNKLLDSVS